MIVDYNSASQPFSARDTLILTLFFGDHYSQETYFLKTNCRKAIILNTKDPLFANVSLLSPFVNKKPNFVTVED